jgi:hypothetical protein
MRVPPPPLRPDRPSATGETMQNGWWGTTFGAFSGRSMLADGAGWLPSGGDPRVGVDPRPPPSGTFRLGERAPQRMRTRASALAASGIDTARSPQRAAPSAHRQFRRVGGGTCADGELSVARALEGPRCSLLTSRAASRVPVQRMGSAKPGSDPSRPGYLLPDASGDRGLRRFRDRASRS